VPAARVWTGGLTLVPLMLAAFVLIAPLEPALMTWSVVAGLVLFGFVFAVNSSVHSYLVLAYAGSEKAAEDVGFYYAANAVGRFAGTLLSGLLYQWAGLLACLVGSGLMLLACFLLTIALPKTR
jgi:predicted MFS family arabinose efflux permease